MGSTTIRILRVFGAAVLLTYVSIAATARADTVRTYRIDEVRNYGETGEAGSSMLLRIASAPQADGATVHSFRTEGVVTYDNFAGFGVVGAKDLPVLTMISSPDRKTLTMPHASAKATETAVRSAAEASKALGQLTGCVNGRGAADLPVTGQGVTAPVRLSFELRKIGNSSCALIYSTRGTFISPVTQQTIPFETRGVALATQDFHTLYASAVAYSGSAGAARIEGRRLTVLKDADRTTMPQELASEFSSLLRAAQISPIDAVRESENVGIDQALMMIDSTILSLLSTNVEVAVLAYGEQRANFAPIPILAALYVVDNLHTTLVNGVGGALVLYGQYAPEGMPGKKTAVDWGKNALSYDGVVGEGIQAVAEWGARKAGYSESQQETAGSVAVGLYDTMGLFAGKFSTAGWMALSRIRYDGSPAVRAAIDLVGAIGEPRDAFQYAMWATNRLSDLSEEVLRRSNDQSPSRLALNQAQHRGSVPVSLTPTGRDLMSGLNSPTPTNIGPSTNDVVLGNRSPRTPSGVTGASSAGLADVMIQGILSFRLFDFAIQDGDIVALSVNSEGRLLLGQTVNLTNAGSFFNIPSAREGALVIIRVTALNTGALFPNTGAINILSVIISGNGSQFYSLQTGQSGVLRVLILGRRARR